MKRLFLFFAVIWLALGAQAQQVNVSVDLTSQLLRSPVRFFPSNVLAGVGMLVRTNGAHNANGVVLTWDGTNRTLYSTTTFSAFGTNDLLKFFNPAGTQVGEVRSNAVARFAGLIIPPGAVNGYVWTSDGSGVGAWLPPTGGGGATNAILNLDGSGTNATIYASSSGTTNLNLIGALQQTLLTMGHTQLVASIGSDAQGDADMFLRDHNGAPMVRLKATGDSYILGDLGVGTNSPQTTFQLHSAVEPNFLQTSSVDDIDHWSLVVKGVQLAAFDSAGSLGGRLSLNTNVTGASKVLLNAGGDSYFLGGKLGIGINAPVVALDVVGAIKSSALTADKLTMTMSGGTVLTSAVWSVTALNNISNDVRGVFATMSSNTNAAVDLNVFRQDLILTNNTTFFFSNTNSGFHTLLLVRNAGGYQFVSPTPSIGGFEWVGGAPTNQWSGTNWFQFWATASGKVWAQWEPVDNDIVDEGSVSGDFIAETNGLGYVLSAQALTTNAAFKIFDLAGGLTAFWNSNGVMNIAEGTLNFHDSDAVISLGGETLLTIAGTGTTTNELELFANLKLNTLSGAGPVFANANKVLTNDSSVTIGGGVLMAASTGTIGFASRSKLVSGADGSMAISNAANTANGTLLIANTFFSQTTKVVESGTVSNFVVNFNEGECSVASSAITNHIVIKHATNWPASQVAYSNWDIQTGLTNRHIYFADFLTNHIYGTNSAIPLTTLMLESNSMYTISFKSRNGANTGVYMSYPIKVGP